MRFERWVEIHPTGRQAVFGDTRITRQERRDGVLERQWMLAEFRGKPILRQPDGRMYRNHPGRIVELPPGLGGPR